MNTNSNLISVIIPTYNAGLLIEEVIQGVFKQKDVNLKLIVVDDNSSDNSREIIEKYPVQLVSLKFNSGPSFARNEGLRFAQSEFIYFLDSDCIIQDKYFLRKLLNILIDKKVDMIGCANVDAYQNKNEFAFVYFISVWYNFSIYAQEGSRKILPAYSMLVRKSVFESVGNFSIRFSDDDFMFCTKATSAGFRLYFTSQLAILHKHNRTTKEKFLEVMRRNGKNGTLFRLVCKSKIPYGKFFINNKFLFTIFGPLIISYASIRVFFKALKNFSSSRVIRTVPLVIYGYLFWFLGLLEGIDEFNSKKMDQQIT